MKDLSKIVVCPKFSFQMIPEIDDFLRSKNCQTSAILDSGVLEINYTLLSKSKISELMSSHSEIFMPLMKKHTKYETHNLMEIVQ